MALFIALLAAAATCGCFPWMFGDDDSVDTVEEDTDPVMCDDEGYWAGSFTVYDELSIFDLAGCRYIQGDLEINDTSLTDLHGLEELRTVGGSLSIGYNPQLASVAGLDGLFEIDGELHIAGNDALTDLGGLEGLFAVGGRLRIDHNAALAAFDGLEGLWIVGGDLDIEDNSSLESLDGLNGLAVLGGDELSVRYNTVLPTCEAEELAARLIANGFDGIVSIDGNGDGTCDEPDGGVEPDAGIDAGIDGGV